jgi:phosphoribosyl 1,2-cyclic phosphodiesterase
MLAQGPYPLALQQRVKSSQGHLANKDAAALLKEIQHNGLTHVVLAHLSEINNLPQLAMKEALKAVPHEDAAKIVLARQDDPTEILFL